MSLIEIKRDEEFHSNLHSPPRNASRRKTEEGLQIKMDSTTNTTQRQSTNTNNGDAGNAGGRNSTSGRAGRKRRRATYRIKRDCGGNTSANSTTSRPGRPKHAALLELLYGSALYATCILLPSLPRRAYQTYLYLATRTAMVRERVLWGIYITWRFGCVVLDRWGWVDDPYNASRVMGGSDDGSGVTGGTTGGGGVRGLRKFGRRVSRYIFSTSTASLWEEFNQKHRQDGVRGVGGVGGAGGGGVGADPEKYTWGYGHTTSAFPAILMVLQDIQFLLVLAVLLAVLRIWFVHMLVPEFLAPRRLEAMTRCKSSHLLSSSSYSFGDLSQAAAGSGGLRRRESLNRSTSNARLDREGKVKRGWYCRAKGWFDDHWFRYNDFIVALLLLTISQTMRVSQNFKSSSAM